MKVFNGLSDRKKAGIDAIALLGALTTFVGAVMIMAPNFLIDLLNSLLDPFTTLGTSTEISVGVLISALGIAGLAYYATIQNLKFEPTTVGALAGAFGILTVFVVSGDFSTWVTSNSTYGLMGAFLTAALPVVPFVNA